RGAPPPGRRARRQRGRGAAASPAPPSCPRGAGTPAGPSPHSGRRCAPCTSRWTAPPECPRSSRTAARPPAPPRRWRRRRGGIKGRIPQIPYKTLAICSKSWYTIRKSVLSDRKSAILRTGKGERRMPRSANQKLKLLCLCKILWERTDEEHPLTVPELIQALEAWDIRAERKSIYDDMEALRTFGLDVQNRKGKAPGWFLGERPFQLAELKLLVDAV